MRAGGCACRGVALVDWRSGLLAYVEADAEALKRFEEIYRLCGGRLERRTLPCMSSLASRLGVKSILYITDIYGITTSLALELQVPRESLLRKAWKLIEELVCKHGEVECDEEVPLSCCVQCGTACILAAVLGFARAGSLVDVRGSLRGRLLGFALNGT